jgi:pimeloyl-ACP methyl ester carboxylesterase
VRFADAVDGTRIFTEHTGAPLAGTAAVLCDGIACEGFIWKYLKPALAEVMPVVHWHYRGHGRSGAPRDRSLVRVQDHARDLGSVLDTLGVRSAVLLGHSMGTQVCLEGYRQRPGTTAGLVLLCGSYGRITRTFHDSDVLRQVLPGALALLEKHPRLVRALWSRGPVELSVTLARWLGEVDAARILPEDLRPYFEHVNHLDLELFLRMLQAAGEHSAEDLLPTLAAPTLVVAGARDQFTPPRYAEQMARTIPGATLFTVPEGSHTAPIEQPERVNAQVLAFVRERCLTAS